MWENADFKSECKQEDAERDITQAESVQREASKEYVSGALLGGQLLFCGLILLFTAATIYWELPWQRGLEKLYERAMQAEPISWEIWEQQLSEFTQKATETLLLLQGEQQGEEATQAPRRIASVRRKNEPPSNASEDSYLPPGNWQLPLAWMPQPTSGYGWRNSPKILQTKEDFHYGVDLPAAQGTPVLATSDAVVRVAAKGDSYGNYLRLLHVGGDESLYAHLQYSFVHSGEVVWAGQVIGAVGQTGQATGPHLHFELLHGGVRYDPSVFLRLAEIEEGES